MDYMLKINGHVVPCSYSQLEKVSPSLAHKSRIASMAGDVLDINVEPEAADVIGHFVKTELFKLDFEKLSNVTYEAYRLNIPTLLRHCENEYLDQLVPANCLESLLFAEGNGCDRLLGKAFNLALEHFERISNMEQFLYIGKSHLNKLVLNVNVSVCPVQSIYDAIMRWYSYESNIRSSDVIEIIRAFSRRIVCRRQQSHKLLSPYYDQSLEVFGEHQFNNTLIVAPTKRANQVVCGDQTTNIICVGQGSKGKLSVVFLTFVNDQLSISTQPISDNEGLAVDTAFCHTKRAIYACGGDEKSDGTRCFDIATRKWEKRSSMFKGRKHHMVCMVNRRLYVLGGVNTNTGKVFEYVDKMKLSTGRWATAGQLDGFVRSAACAAYGEDIYVFGGLTSQNRTNPTIQCYHTKTRKTTNIGMLPTKSLICRAVVEGGEIYLIAMNGQVVKFNVQVHELEILPNCPNSGKGCGAFIQDGFLYVFGGKPGSRRQQRFSQDIHRLDLRNPGSQWKFVATLPQPISVLSCSKTFLDVK